MPLPTKVSTDHEKHEVGLTSLDIRTVRILGGIVQQPKNSDRMFAKRVESTFL